MERTTAGRVAIRPVHRRPRSEARWLRLRRRPGWTLHLSAGLSSAEDVLRRSLPVLLAESAAFKLAASPDALAALNEGHGAYSQVGKFLTVYPNDDAQAVRLALALDEATRGLR